MSVCCLANLCVTFCADGPRCHSGEAVAGRVHAAENGNPHSLEKTWREGEDRSLQICDVLSFFIYGLMDDSEACAPESHELLKLH